MQQCKYEIFLAEQAVSGTRETAQCDRQCRNKWLFHLNKQLLKALDNATMQNIRENMSSQSS